MEFEIEGGAAYNYGKRPVCLADLRHFVAGRGNMFLRGEIASEASSPELIFIVCRTYCREPEEHCYNVASNPCPNKTYAPKCIKVAQR
jgi:hypothetical protein